MDPIAALREVQAGMADGTFRVVHNPEQEPAVRQLLAELLEVLNRSGDVVV